VEIKCQLDATEVFIADLIACSTCFGHHYADHQELKSIIEWLLPVVFRAVVFKLLCVRFTGCWRILQTGLLRSWVRIPPGVWMFVCCECCVLSGRGLCDGLITRPKKSYRLWRVVLCNQESS